ncbi:MAG: hypothetical protein IT196_16645 [Acidimicrobiales bacterium]|nr:hypothetical protein [Acidimicrobiales bacterium]
MGPRIRRLLLSRVLRGDLRRWAIYLVVSSLWRRYRKLAGKEPEVVYRSTLRRNERFAMATSKPLPRRLRTKKVHDALEAAARADLA